MSRLRNDTEMFGHSLRNIGLLLLFCLAMGAPACADGPSAKFQLLEDETVTSPDRQVRVEQYATDLGDEGYLHQFWAFDSDHQHGSLLNPGEGTDLAGYPAGFRFSPDSQWLVRMQKLGAGYQTLFLYRRDRDSIVIRHGQAARGSRLGLFLQPAGIEADAPGPEGSLFAGSRAGRSCSKGWKRTTRGWDSTGPTAATS